MEQPSENPSLGYKLLWRWTKYVYTHIYYRKTHYLHKDRIPKAGTPIVCVSNHQNSLCDSLGSLFAFDMRFLHHISRADVFRQKQVAKFLRGLGIIPVYRIRDGREKIKDNIEMFDQVEQYVEHGNTLVIYPEATHMDGNWLGRFYLSYTRIAFEAAAKSDFQKDIVILPHALYYKDFKKLQSEMMADFCEPFSLKPYYERYKEQPRQTQEEVNEIIREKIREKVLDIQDKEHYQTIMDFLEYSQNAFMREKEIDNILLPEELAYRKKLSSLLEQKQQSDSDFITDLYAHTDEYTQGLKKNRINEYALFHPFGKGDLPRSGALYLLLFPFYLLGMIPHILLYNIAPFVGKRLEDKLMQASIDICVWTFGIPLFYLIFFLLIGCCGNWLTALLFVLLAPSFGKLALWYHRNFQQDLKCFRAGILKRNKTKWSRLGELRQALDQDLKTLEA